MIEIAICLAIIGIALVGIIAVLPVGMHTQRDTRQETIIAQDASYLMDLVRNGSHGPDELTNYIFAATNYWYWTGSAGSGSGMTGYNYNGANNVILNGSAPPSTNFLILAPMNSGSNIVSLLSTPEFMEPNGKPIQSFVQGGISNHIVFYVRAISGLAAEKTPQDNPILQQDTFTYRVLAVNAPMPMDLPPVWDSTLSYAQGNRVYSFYKQWVWVAATNSPAGDTPGSDANWARSNPYADQLSLNQRELRLRFIWPQLPNGNLAAAPSFQSFRTTIGGQLVQTNDRTTYHPLYYYQPQSYSQLP